MSTRKNNIVTSTFYIKGMHCASCELIIEKTLIKENTVQMVNASLADGILQIEHLQGDRITPSFLNQLFSQDGYRFSLKPFKNKNQSQTTAGSACPTPDARPVNPYQALFFGLLLIIGFILLNHTGFVSLVSVNQNSSLPVFFLFGLLAGFSSCAALVGGIVLSMSKQWLNQFGAGDDTGKKMEPHILFNTGRVLGYTFFGGLLGLVGNFFSLSPVFTALLILTISIVMILLGLQMLGVKSLSRFQLRLPKSITSSLADESNFSGKHGPLLMGALTFFLPCGFTITAQALALASGSLLQGALIMGFFALGTLPGLLAIGFSSVKMYSDPKRSAQFSMVAGLLVLFFALYNINNQLAVLGLPSYSTVFAQNNSSSSSASTQTPLAPLENGKQVIKMDVSSVGYTPNQFTVKAGTPVSWQITNDGSGGCASTIVAQGLFSGRINTIPGQVVAQEFTPQKPGVYRFSCSMGMYTGIINVIDVSGSTGSSVNAQPVDSGAKGCGCGGGGGGSGSCGGL